MREINLGEAIDFSKDIIWYGDNKNYYDKYSRGYFNTTECIKEYLSKENYNRGRALSVLASGDHIFNLIYQGFREIDAFDINVLQYFVYHFKRALILECSWEEYKLVDSILTSGDVRGRYVLQRVNRYLPDMVRKYWEEIFLYLEVTNKSLERLFSFSHSNSFLANNYLSSREDYQKLRGVLNDARVN